MDLERKVQSYSGEAKQSSLQSWQMLVLQFFFDIYSEDFHLHGLSHFWWQNIEVLLPATLSRLHCPKQVTRRRRRTELPSLPPHHHSQGWDRFGAGQRFPGAALWPLPSHSQHRQSRTHCSSWGLPAPWCPFCRAPPLLAPPGNNVRSIQQLPLPECKGGLRTWMERGEQREAAQRNN